MSDTPPPDRPRVVEHQHYGEEYLAALKTEFASDHKVLFDYLYQCLSIIDAKSASLLQFNSIIIAASTVLLGLLASVIRRTPSFAWVANLTVVAMLLMLGSSCILLRAVWIYWARTSEIRAGGYLRELLVRRTKRTAWYRWAWWLSVLSLPIYFVDLTIAYLSYLR
jgi:hypothetical protein